MGSAVEGADGVLVGFYGIPVQIAQVRLVGETVANLKSFQQLPVNVVETYFSILSRNSERSVT